MKELETFLSETRQRALWIMSDDRTLKVYVRRSKRYFRNEMIECLDIASVEVDPLSRRQGRFKRLVELMELRAIELGYGGVFVESVQNRLIRPLLVRRGYEFYGTEHEVAPSYIKKVS